MSRVGHEFLRPSHPPGCSVHGLEYPDHFQALTPRRVYDTLAKYPLCAGGHTRRGPPAGAGGLIQIQHLHYMIHGTETKYSRIMLAWCARAVRLLVLELGNQPLYYPLISHCSSGRYCNNVRFPRQFPLSSMTVPKPKTNRVSTFRTASVHVLGD